MGCAVVYGSVRSFEDEPSVFVFRKYFHIAKLTTMNGGTSQGARRGCSLTVIMTMAVDGIMSSFLWCTSIMSTGIGVPKLGSPYKED